MDLPFKTPDIGKPHWDSLLVATVGLPGRGKSLLARKLSRYLNYIGETTQVFDVSEYRRKQLKTYQSHRIFDPDNVEAKQLRNECFLRALNDAIEFVLVEGNSIALLDGPNVCPSQRAIIERECSRKAVRVCFVECFCDDENIVNRNFHSILKYSADYHNMSLGIALKDFQCKVEHYNKQYIPCLPSLGYLSSPLIRVDNDGLNGVIAQGVRGKESMFLSYLAQPKLQDQILYFSRHGESEFNVLGRIGGDSDLSPRGYQYSRLLCNYLKTLPLNEIWTSTLRRTKSTVAHISLPKYHRHELDELHSGNCEGYTYEELLEKYPKDMALRDADKLNYRYPQGESYTDIMRRLLPVLKQLESESNVLVVAHQAVLRCVLAYFLGTPSDEIPYVNVPLHTLIKLTLTGHSYTVEMIKMPVDCVDTNRIKPANCSVDRKKEEVLRTIPAHYDSLAQV